MNSDPAVNRGKYSVFVKPLLGLCLLGVVITWIAKEGELIDKLSLGMILASTIASFTINLANASVILTIVRAFRGKINYASALHISALGAFGNAAGGLPIGTTIKYVILYKQSGLKIREITSGLILFSIAISIYLLCYAAISIWQMLFPIYIKIIPSILLLTTVILIWLSGRWASKQNSTMTLIQPLLSTGNLRQIVLISFFMATLFLANYLIISVFLFPATPLISMVFITSTGMLAGLGSLLQSVGGIQEFSMGVASHVSGGSLVNGMQLALVMRVTSLISSGITLLILYFSPSKLRPSQQ